MRMFAGVIEVIPGKFINIKLAVEVVIEEIASRGWSNKIKHMYANIQSNVILV